MICIRIQDFILRAMGNYGDALSKKGHDLSCMRPFWLPVELQWRTRVETKKLV